MRPEGESLLLCDNRAWQWDSYFSPPLQQQFSQWIAMNIVYYNPHQFLFVSINVKQFSFPCIWLIVVIVESLSSVWFSESPRTAACQLLCPSLSPGVCSNACPLSQWCHPTISSSVTCFSSCPRAFPASESFPMALCIRWPKVLTFSFSLSPSNEYSGLVSFRMDWFDLHLSKGFSRVFSSTTVQSINSLALRLLCGPTLTSVHDHWKNHSFYKMDLCQQKDASAV